MVFLFFFVILTFFHLGPSEKSPLVDAVMMLSLLPHVLPSDDEDTLTELVFLIDRSGSMAGMIFY